MSSGLEVRVAAAEGAERLQRVPAVAPGEQLGPEEIAVGAAEAAVFLEPFHGVGVQDLAPDVGVVAGGVPAARENVLEVAGPVARRDQAVGDPGRGQGLRLEFDGVVREVGAVQDMPGQVQQGRAEVLGGAEAFAPELRGVQLVHGLLRQGLAGGVVPGIVGQDLGPHDPHFVDLRRVFHEVPRHVRTGEPRIGDVGEQAVEGMAELVERGAEFVQRQQGGLAGRRAWRC